MKILRAQVSIWLNIMRQRKKLFIMLIYFVWEILLLARWRNWIIVRGRKYLIFLEWPEKAKGLPTPDARLEILLGEHHIEKNRRDLSIYFKEPNLLEDRCFWLPK